MQLHRKSKGGRFRNFLLLLLTLLLLGGGGYTAIVFFEKELPSVSFSEDIQYLGKKSTFTITAKDGKSGLRSVQLQIKQNEAVVDLIDKRFPRKGYTGVIGDASYTEEVNFDFEKTGLKDGEAELVATVRDYSLRGLFSGNIRELRRSVVIDTIPPKISLLHSERYISPGGSGIVLYQIHGDAVKHGAQFAGRFHTGHPLGDGRDDVFIAYIALPYDVESIEKSSVVAVDGAGNTNNYPFSPRFKNVRQKTDRINVSNNFLNVKIPEFQQFYPEMQGSLVEKYLYTNREVRKANNEKIYDLCQSPHSTRLWKGKFYRMPGASKAGYADRRTYFYNGKEIDRQVHLGMDIASTRRAEIRAANDGIVIFADYIGIYGNMVILDHGQGVFSLYSHMSNINVAIDDKVSGETVLGLTGTSGMAGGDHLHFSMLINGVFVTPKEWWDQQWINVTIEDPIADSRF